MVYSQAIDDLEELTLVYTLCQMTGLEVDRVIKTRTKQVPSLPLREVLRVLLIEASKEGKYSI